MASIVDSAGRVLRALQKLDEVKALGPARVLLIEAEDELGALLGLNCTGERQGDRLYDHSAGTCPVHEWLDTADYDAVHAQFPRGTAG